MSSLKWSCIIAWPLNCNRAHSNLFTKLCKMDLLRRNFSRNIVLQFIFEASFLTAQLGALLWRKDSIFDKIMMGKSPLLQPNEYANELLFFWEICCLMQLFLKHFCNIQNTTFGFAEFILKLLNISFTNWLSLTTGILNFSNLQRKYKGSNIE